MDIVRDGQIDGGCNDEKRVETDEMKDLDAVIASCLVDKYN